MPVERRYNIVFSGTYADGIEEAAAHAALSALFKTDIANIRSIFARAGTIIKKNLAEAAARKYIDGLQGAGAICSMAVAAPPAAPHGVVREPASGGPPVVACSMGATELTYAPIATNRITASPGGINLNRADIQEVPCRDLALISVFCQKSPEHSYILFYLRQRPRPFIGDGNKIAYSEFPGVRADSMVASLRNLAAFLCAQNPALAVDEATHAFMTGSAPQQTGDDPAMLTTALGKALQARPPETVPPPAPGAPAAPEAAPLEAKPATTTAPPAASPPPGRPAAQAPEECCPKCGTPTAGRPDCSSCGLVFAKWQALQERRKEDERQRQAASASAEPPPVPILTAETDADELEAWTRRGAQVYGWMLIAGFLLPLLKYSVMFGKTVIVWPWQVIGLGINKMETGAAMATLSSGGNMLLWGLLPLVGGIVMLVYCRRAPQTARSIGMLAAGAILLVLLLGVLIDEAEIMGLAFVPPTVAGGIMILIVVVSGALVAAANHLRRECGNLTLLRIISGIGGVLLTACMTLQLLAANDAWGGWSMIVLYLGMILYGILGLVCAVRPVPADELTRGMSLLPRAILWLAPFACLIAQRWSSGAFVEYVIGGGGSLIHIASGVAKCFLIYYGSAFLLAMGLCALLAQRLTERS